MINSSGALGGGGGGATTTQAITQLSNQLNGMGSYNVATSKAVNLEFIQTSASQVMPSVPLFSGNLITPADDVEYVYFTFLNTVIPCIMTKNRLFFR